MGGYLINFSIYTTAMIGVIFLALYAFKALSGNAFSKKSSNISIEDQINLSARKKLYVINAQGQKFLIAADIDTTALIARLDDNSSSKELPVREDKSSALSSLDGIESMEEFASIIEFKKNTLGKKPMMKELARKLSAI